MYQSNAKSNKIDGGFFVFMDDEQQKKMALHHLSDVCTKRLML